MSWDSICQAGCPLDVNMLNAVVMTTVGGNPADAQRAMGVIDRFYLREDLLNFVPDVLQGQCHEHTKKIYLASMKKWIAQSWAGVSPELQERVKGFLKEFITACVGQNMRNLAESADEVLVAIATIEWPDEWADFLTEICEQSLISAEFCRNGLFILSILSSAILEWLNDSVRGARATKMAFALGAGFAGVQKMIFLALDSGNPDLVELALRVLKNSNTGILVGESFDGALLKNVIERYGQTQELMILILELLESVLAPRGYRGRDTAEKYQIPEVFAYLIQACSQLFTDESAFENQRLVTSFLEVLPKMLTSVEAAEKDEKYGEALTCVLRWAMRMSYSCDDDSVSTCLDFWDVIVSRCVNCKRRHMSYELYEPFFGPIAEFIVGKMPTPFDIMSSHDLFNREKWIFRMNELSGNGFHPARTGLIVLFELKKEEMIGFFHTRLDSLISAEWNPDAWSKFVWAVGAVSGVVERLPMDFFSKFLRALFGLGEGSTDAERKSLVAIYVTYITVRGNSFFNRFPELIRSLARKVLSFLATGSRTVQVFVVNNLRGLIFPVLELLTQEEPGGGPSILEDFVNKVPGFVANMPDGLACLLLQNLSSAVGSFKNVIVSARLSELLAQIGFEGYNCVLSKFNPESIEYNLLVRRVMRINSSLSSNLAKLYLNSALEFIPKLCEMVCHYSAVLREHGSVENPTIVSVVKARRSVLKMINSYMSIGCVTQSGLVVTDPVMALAVDFASQPPQYRESFVIRVFISVCVNCINIFDSHLPQIYTSLFLPCAEFAHSKLPDDGHCLMQMVTLVNLGCRMGAAFPYKLGPNELKVVLDTVVACCESFDLETSNAAILCLSNFYAMVGDAAPENSPGIVSTFLLSHVLFMFQLITDTVHKAGIDSQITGLWSLMKHPYVSQKYDELYTNVCELYPTISPEVHREMMFSLMNDLGSGNMHGFIVTITEFVVSLGRISPRDPVLERPTVADQKERLMSQIQQIPGVAPVLEGVEPGSSPDVSALVEAVRQFSSM